MIGRQNDAAAQGPTRPYASFDVNALIARAATAAKESPSDLDTMLHCWAEASFRHEPLTKLMAFRNLFERVKVASCDAPNLVDIEPPSWFLEAFTAAQRLSRGCSVRKNRRVYVLLLRGLPGSTANEVGLYVGETYWSAEKRFRQHLDGEHASSIVRRCGIAVLHSFCPQLDGLSGYHSKRLEAELAARLRAVMISNRLSPSRVQGGH
jgi:hypothetical protein